MGFVTFYEFLQEFVKIFAKLLVNGLIKVVFKACVDRMLWDTKKRQESGEGGTVVIDKCCNVLRLCLENQIYMPQLKDDFEELLKPLYLHMSDPLKISFEDDIILMLKTQIRKRKEVSPTMWEIFQMLPKVLDKNKHAFGNLFETVNYYMIVGKQQLAESPESIKVICQMADTALFTNMPNKTINNTEGTMLLQMLFQVMAGSEALN